jgi:hypothetical protein
MGAATGTPWSREIGIPQPIGAIAEAAMNNRRVACIVLTFSIRYSDNAVQQVDFKWN